MKKLISFFTVLFLLSFCIETFAQLVTIPAANTNSGSKRNPYGSYYGYARTDMIYTASEVGTTGLITTVGFFVNSLSSPAASTPVVIRMKTTTSSTITASTYATAITGATIVWSGNVTSGMLSANNWVTITLTTPFSYTADNLEVLVETNGGGTGIEGSTAKQFRASAPSPAAVRFQGWEADNSPPTVNGTTSPTRCNIQLNFLVACNIGITNLNPVGTYTPGCTPLTVAPKANISNTGSNPQTGITVTYDVPSESYSATVGAPDLAPGANQDVNFPATLPINSGSPGVKNVTITVNSTCSGAQVYSLNTSYTVSAVNPNFGGADGGGYFFANSSSGASCAPNQPIYFWEDTTGSTYLVNGAVFTPTTSGNLDDGYWTINPPFASGDGIQFYGTCYTQIQIGTNGMIGLGSSTIGMTSFSTLSIPSTTAARPAVFPLWFDQNWGEPVVGRTLSYKVSGQKLIITYNHAPHYNLVDDPLDYVSYQVIMDIGIACGSGNGDIIVQYDDANSGSSFMTKYNNGTMGDNTVGIQNAAGTIATQYRRQIGGVLQTPSLGPLFSSPLAVAFGVNQNALPVELASFTATSNGNNVDLLWSTTTETNNAGFDIERSSVNGSWTKVANVAGNGTTTSASSYSYTDRNVASGNYNYRLKQIDFNGNFAYYNLSNEVNVGIPTKYDLSQNYPNPFNPSTSIAYQIPFDGQVSLKIFDMSGKEVATLVNEVKTAGYYTYNFNASSLSSGVYFYSLSANNFTATKKMMLLK